MRQTTLTEEQSQDRKWILSVKLAFYRTGRENNSLENLTCEYNVCSSPHVSVELRYRKYFCYFSFNPICIHLTLPHFSLWILYLLNKPITISKLSHLLLKELHRVAFLRNYWLFSWPLKELLVSLLLHKSPSLNNLLILKYFKYVIQI